MLPGRSHVERDQGEVFHVRNDSASEATFFVYGAPPIADAADELLEPVVPRDLVGE